VLLPVFCFLIAAGGSPDAPDWQSGQYDDYVSLLLAGNTTWVFYPFLAYSMVCLLIVMFRPETGNRYFLVRFGVYSGVILALHYVFVLGVVLLDVHDLTSWRSIAKIVLGIPMLSLVAVAVPTVGWLLVWVVVRLWQRYPRVVLQLLLASVLFGMVMIVAVCIFDATGRTLGDVPVSAVVFGPVFLLIIGSLASAPTWAAAVYAYQSVRLLKLRASQLQVKLWQFLAIFTWIAAYLAAWRAAIMLMLEAYAQLPVEPPDDCYIATAAARGHRRVVGSREIVRRDGSIRRVNLQLAYFKCGELALQATVPQLHWTVRRVYDTLGPHLGRLIVHPAVADLAYLALKPLEWLTRLALVSLLGDVSPTVRKMYR
jgi:hypothetical protein